jgi:hypothetical protein
MRTECDALGPAGQARARHDLGPAWREDADAVARRHGPEALGDNETEDCIADEGQPIVVGGVGVLVGVRAVCECLLKEPGIGEIVVEETAERARRIRRDGPGYGRYFRNARMAFVPPKPKALLSATSTSCLRAWFGT